MVAILHQVVRASYSVETSGYSCTMTAGDGFSQGYIEGSFGSIDVQPVPGHDLYALATLSGGGNVILYGDATALLAGLSVWVDGIEYPFDGYDWTFTAGATYAEWTSAGPTFVDTVEYLIEFK